MSRVFFELPSNGSAGASPTGSAEPAVSGAKSLAAEGIQANVWCLARPGARPFDSAQDRLRASRRDASAPGQSVGFAARNVQLKQSSDGLHQLMPQLSEQASGLPREPDDATRTPGDLVRTLYDSARTPGDLVHTPGDLVHTPGDWARTPGDWARTPGDWARTPGDLASTPDDSARTPGDLVRTPDDLVRTPGD